MDKEDSAHNGTQRVKDVVELQLSDDVNPKSIGSDVRVRYTILEVPPWFECGLLGFQHYLTMLGATVLIPFLLVPAMGGTSEDLAYTIGTIFFISGVITLVQTFIGDRLPIIQGGSFAYLTPAFAIIGSIAAANPDLSGHERFLLTMRNLSGGIIGSGLIVAAIGASGILSIILRWISPITVAANIGIVGLSLFTVGWNGVALCPYLGMTQIATIIIFSQYMKKLYIPLPGGIKWKVFELFPVLLGIAVTWSIGAILTSAGVFADADAKAQQYCQTNQSDALSIAPWFRFPYPGQWGWPIFTWTNVVTMLAGALSAMVESMGDYYAAARIAGAPVPPPSLISRAVFIQGCSCVLTGLWGTGNGTTAYNENIGAMQITGVGSRRVVQVGAAIIIVVSLIGKFGGLFASMPSAMVNGLFCIMFGLIAAVGLSQMQHADQNSPRNLFILGFALFNSLSIYSYFTTNGVSVETNCTAVPPIQTGSQAVNDIFNAILTTPAATALIITMFLDNTIPGTDEERGLHVWRYSAEDGDWWEDDHLNRVYGLPFNLTRKWQRAVGVPFRRKLRACFGMSTTPSPAGGLDPRADKDKAITA